MEDWWAEVERDVLRCLEDHGTTSVEELAHWLAISESAAVSLLAQLAREGKVRICAVEAVTDARGRVGAPRPALAPAPRSGAPAHRARPGADPGRAYPAGPGASAARPPAHTPP